MLYDDHDLRENKFLFSSKVESNVFKLLSKNKILSTINLILKYTQIRVKLTI